MMCDLHKPSRFLIAEMDNVLIKPITEVSNQTFEPQHCKNTFCRLGRHRQLPCLDAPALAAFHLPPAPLFVAGGDAPRAQAAPYQLGAQQLPEHIFMGNVLQSK